MLVLGLTVDMARCLSIIGVAREVAALTNATLHLPPDELSSSNGNGASDYVTVEIDDPELCNRYTGMMIKEVQIGESPKWMQDRLIKAGMRPISNVVDISNYVSDPAVAIVGKEVCSLRRLNQNSRPLEPAKQELSGAYVDARRRAQASVKRP